MKCTIFTSRLPHALAASIFALTGALAVPGVSAQTAPQPAAAAAAAAERPTKIGFVNTERILRDSNPAKAAQAKIEAEFKGRDDELQKLATSLRTQAEKYDKDAPVLSESERTRRQRDLFNLDTDLQRKRGEFQEDFNRRRNEEFSVLIDRANEVIKTIAEQGNYDLILQDAVTVNPRIDITDQVIRALK